MTAECSNYGCSFPYVRSQTPLAQPSCNSPFRMVKCRAFVGQVLVPALRPSDIVVLDDLSSHKREKILQLIRSAGAEVWSLASYSSGLNPIENVFAKIKPCRRSLACRSRETLWSAMQGVLSSRPNTFRLRLTKPLHDLSFASQCGARDATGVLCHSRFGRALFTHSDTPCRENAKPQGSPHVRLGCTPAGQRWLIDEFRRGTASILRYQ